jgi:chaperonin cofactor prefoldin
MADAKIPVPTGTLEKKIERATKAVTNLNTIAAAVISAVGAIFAAGVYYSNLKHTLDDYVKRIEALEAQQSLNQKEIAALGTEFSAEKQAIRFAVNNAFIQLLKLDNINGPFVNMEPTNSGGGASPTTPPGRCQIGQVVVGLSPFKDSSGIRGISMQCGEIPRVQVN